ncbi:rRNA N-glycosidase [Hordeum vulgare]|nr:rRNA N-glycosidase [Hordeum vulgare]
MTHPKGWIVLRISPSASSLDYSDSIFALYRTMDMYLDSIVVNQVCYRFSDHNPTIVLPQELCKGGIVIMRLMSNYPGLGFNSNKSDQITVGDDVIRKHYLVLLGIANMGLSQEEGASRSAMVSRAREKGPSDQKAEALRFLSLKKALLFFVLLAEALRFPELENWLLNLLAKKLEMSVPVNITKLFRRWGKLSLILHEGREKFNIDNITDEVLKKECKTYTDVCSKLGIADKINLRKLEKKKKKNRL